MAENKIILKISNLNYSDELINFNFNLEFSKSSINSIVCFDNSASSLLKILGNIEENFDGAITSDDKLKILYVPPKPASFPWLNVEENIKYVIKNSDYKRELSDHNISEIIADVELKGYEKHFPDNNSLGFRFRILLANILAIQADVILIDNTFELMDNETKFEIYDLLKSLTTKYNNSIVLLTKHISEAIYLSENIFLMKNGTKGIFNKLNLKDEWAKLDKGEKRDRKLILKEKIINLFLNEDINCIL